MKIEFNLVTTTGIGADTFQLISRKRVLLTSGTAEELMYEFKSFLQANKDTLINSVSDPNFLDRIISQTLTAQEVFNIKTYLTQAGLDILIYCLDDTDDLNEFDIPEGQMEYLVADCTDVRLGFVPSANRLSKDSLVSSYSELLSLISDLKGMNGGTLDLPNPILADNIEVIKKSEASGRTPSSLSEFVTNILKYNGQKIVFIYSGS